MTSGEHLGETPELITIQLDPEREDFSGVWWAISRGGLAYAAFGRDAEEASRRVAGEVGMPYETMHLVPVFSSIYDQEWQDRYTTEFGEKGVARIIPFSNEPWPEDTANMTEAQKEAFNRLKRD